MATTGKRQNKSAFLRDLFRKDPGVKIKDAEKAWTDAGNEGKIASSSFYNARNDLNKGTGDTAAAGKPKPKSKGPKVKKTTKPGRIVLPEVNGQDPTPTPVSVASSSRTGERRRVFDEVEDGIDDLLFKLKTLGGVPEVQEALRAARRLLYGSHH